MSDSAPVGTSPSRPSDIEPFIARRFGLRALFAVIVGAIGGAALQFVAGGIGCAVLWKVYHVTNVAHCWG